MLRRRAGSKLLMVHIPAGPPSDGRSDERTALQMLSKVERSPSRGHPIGTAARHHRRDQSVAWRNCPICRRRGDVARIFERRGGGSGGATLGTPGNVVAGRPRTAGSFSPARAAPKTSAFGVICAGCAARRSESVRTERRVRSIWRTWRGHPERPSAAHLASVYVFHNSRTFASAPNPKFAHQLQRVRLRTSGSKGGTRIIDLLVSL